MINDKFFRSISALTAISDMVAKSNKVFETSGMSLAIEKSTNFIRGAENVAKYTKGATAMLDSIAWVHRNPIAEYSNFASGAMAYNAIANYPKLPAVSQWAIDLNNPIQNAMKGAFTAQNYWMMGVPDNSAVKTAINVISGFSTATAASRSIINMSKVSESILRFDASVNHLYKFLKEDEDEEKEFQLEIDSGLNSALTYDIDNASNENHIAIIHVTQYVLDTFSTMAENFKNGNDYELFTNWLTEFLDELKNTGVRTNVVRVLLYFLLPLLSITDILSDDNESSNTYITESTFKCTTIGLKSLKEFPDNRHKSKIIIPSGTTLTILEDGGKWVKVKFTLEGIYYSGWTLNTDIK